MKIEKVDFERVYFLYVNRIMIFQIAVCAVIAVTSSDFFFHICIYSFFPIDANFFNPIEGLQIEKVGGIAEVKCCSLSICQLEPVKASQPVAWG